MYCNVRSGSPRSAEFGREKIICKESVDKRNISRGVGYCLSSARQFLWDCETVMGDRGVPSGARSGRLAPCRSGFASRSVKSWMHISNSVRIMRHRREIICKSKADFPLQRQVASVQPSQQCSRWGGQELQSSMLLLQEAVSCPAGATEGELGGRPCGFHAPCSTWRADTLFAPTETGSYLLGM